MLLHVLFFFIFANYYMNHSNLYMSSIEKICNKKKLKNENKKLLKKRVKSIQKHF